MNTLDPPAADKVDPSQLPPPSHLNIISPKPVVSISKREGKWRGKERGRGRRREGYK